MFLVTLLKKIKNKLEFPRIQENKESIDSFGATERVHHIKNLPPPLTFLLLSLDGSPRTEQANESSLLPMTPHQAESPCGEEALIDITA